MPSSTPACSAAPLQATLIIKPVATPQHNDPAIAAPAPNTIIIRYSASANEEPKTVAVVTLGDADQPSTEPGAEPCAEGFAEPESFAETALQETTEAFRLFGEGFILPKDNLDAALYTRHILAGAYATDPRKRTTEQLAFLYGDAVRIGVSGSDKKRRRAEASVEPDPDVVVQPRRRRLHPTVSDDDDLEFIDPVTLERVAY